MERVMAYLGHWEPGCEMELGCSVARLRPPFSFLSILSKRGVERKLLVGRVTERGGVIARGWSRLQGGKTLIAHGEGID